MVDLPPELLHFSLGLCLELQNICAMVRKWWGLLIPSFLGIPFFMACIGFLDLHEWLPHEFQSAGSLAPPQLSAVPSPFLAASEKEHQSPTQTQAIGNPSKGKEKHRPRRFKLGSKDGMLFKADPKYLMIFWALIKGYISYILKVKHNPGSTTSFCRCSKSEDPAAGPGNAVSPSLSDRPIEILC